MGTNCAPLVADLLLFCYERDFMLSLSDNNQADIIEAFNSTCRYLEMFLALLPMVYIFLSLFVLLECALMLMTSTT